jgi:hypothetical protein
MEECRQAMLALLQGPLAPGVTADVRLMWDDHAALFEYHAR